jgi:dethiobiotin synthase
MLRGLFITGTDTNVGKTVTAAALMHRYRELGNLIYWKPIQTGIEQDDDTATVAKLGACRDDEVWNRGIRLRGAVSPHLAAEWNGTRIDLAELQSHLADAPAERRWMIEGAGGVLVPVNERDMMIDFMVQLALPLLIVARSTLGTINHTLLTIEVLRSRSLDVAGVVMVGDKSNDNRRAIENYGKIEVVAEMPYFGALSPESLAQWAKTEFDVDRALF